jgi:hypothetical protein
MCQAFGQRSFRAIIKLNFLLWWLLPLLLFSFQMKYLFFREFLDVFKRVIVLVVRVLFKAKYETSFSGFLSNV